MHFWICADLSKPPEFSTMVRRRPVRVPYWESKSFRKREALHQLRERWMRVTGKTCPNSHNVPKDRPTILRESSTGRRRGVDVNKDKD